MLLMRIKRICFIPLEFLQADQIQIKIEKAEAQLKPEAEKSEAQLKPDAEKVEAQLKLEEMELRQSEIQADIGSQELTGQERSIPSKEFNVGKHVRMVPPFHEAEVNKYFQHFEKVDKNLE